MFSKDFLLSLAISILGTFLLFGVSLAVDYTKDPDDFYVPFFKDKIEFTDYSASHPVIPLPKTNLENDLRFTASSILAIDDYSQAMLFEKDSADKKMLASITKLMSALVILDLPRDWNEEIEVLEIDAHPNGSHYLEVGAVYTANELWNVALVGSSNKAINALVRTSGVTKNGFISLMNKKAIELNLNSLNFVEPTGLDDENTGSAQDIVRLLREALKYKKISETLFKNSFELSDKTVWSTNWLKTRWTPHDFDFVLGKTGYIELSGYNFVGRLEKNGHKILVAVFGAQTNEKRFEEARDLSEWVFDNFVWPGEDEYRQLVENRK